MHAYSVIALLHAASAMTSTLPPTTTTPVQLSMAQQLRLPSCLFPQPAMRVVLHLFSGHRRPGDVQEALEAKTQGWHTPVHMLSLDVAISEEYGNLRGYNVVAR